MHGRKRGGGQHEWWPESSAPLAPPRQDIAPILLPTIAAGSAGAHCILSYCRPCRGLCCCNIATSLLHYYNIQRYCYITTLLQHTTILLQHYCIITTYNDIATTLLHYYNIQRYCYNITTLLQHTTILLQHYYIITTYNDIATTLLHYYNIH